MRVTHPASPHPLPICCCALEGIGERHWSLPLSLMHAHTPPSTSLSIHMFHVFVGNGKHFLLSFSIYWLASTICWHCNTAQVKHLKPSKVDSNIFLIVFDLVRTSCWYEACLRPNPSPKQNSPPVVDYLGQFNQYSVSIGIFCNNGSDEYWCSSIGWGCSLLCTHSTVYM